MLGILIPCDFGRCRQVRIDSLHFERGVLAIDLHLATGLELLIAAGRGRIDFL
jgi:hypothetical protein